MHTSTKYILYILLRINDNDILDTDTIKTLLNYSGHWNLFHLQQTFPLLSMIICNAVQVKWIIFLYSPYKDDINWSMMLFCWKLCHFKAIIVYFLQKYSIYVFKWFHDANRNFKEISSFMMMKRIRNLWNEYFSCFVKNIIVFDKIIVLRITLFIVFFVL